MTRFPTLATLAAPVLAGTLALTLAGCGGGDATTPVADGTTATDSGSTSPATGSSGATSTSAPTAPTSSGATASGGATKAVPVYFVGDTPEGPRLFPELRQVSADQPMAGAAALLMTGQTLDPDYRSLVPSGMDITDVALSDGTIVVTVGPDAQISPDKSMSSADAKLAVQQLVYTLQAASGTHDKVQVSQGSGATEIAVPLLGVRSTLAGAPAAASSAVLAPVSVTSPAQGADVSGTMTASGTADSFEGEVPWDLRRGGADGTVVRSGSAQAEGAARRGAQADWSTTVDLAGLAPGDYTFTAHTADASGKGTDVSQDTKAITVS